MAIFDHRQTRMAAMKKAGATYQEIADEFGISRQRVHQIIGYLVGPLRAPRPRRAVTAQVAERIQQAASAPGLPL